MFKVRTDLAKVKAPLLTSWTDYLVSLSLRFSICKMRVTILPSHRVSVSILRKFCVKHLVQLKNILLLYKYK